MGLWFKPTRSKSRVLVQPAEPAGPGLRSVLEEAKEIRTTNHEIQDWKWKLIDAAPVYWMMYWMNVVCLFLPHLHLKNIWFRYRISRRMKEISEGLWSPS